MDFLLSKVTQHAMNYAIRSGITITSGFAIQQCSRLLKSKNLGGQERDAISNLQRRLESKIRIISPAIDMIELITARGNTSLESAVSLTKALRLDIQNLGVRLSKAAANEELSRKGSSKAKSCSESELELKLIVSDMRKLLEKIEDAVPLISLAITTSGVSLSTNLPASISPSRLLQASTFLSAGDSQYTIAPRRFMQIGPAFTLSMYMLFSGHLRMAQDEEELRNTTWKEVIHKARLKLIRVPLNNVLDFPYSSQNYTHNSDGKVPEDKSDDEEEDHSQFPSQGRADEFAYQLTIVEDLDDDRVHTFEDDEEQPGPLDDVETAGLRELLPIHQVSKIFYADTGKILNIGSDGETNNPILLLKRDINAVPPRRMMEGEQFENEWQDEYPESHADADDVREREGGDLKESLRLDYNHDTRTRWSLPPGLDPEWMAFEVYNEDPESDTESEPVTETPKASTPQPGSSSRQGSVEPGLTVALSNMDLNSSTHHTPSPYAPGTDLYKPSRLSPARTPINPFASTRIPIRTSLSLLEMLIRLTSLQQFQQCSHLAINDELLNFFLEESSTTGAAPGDMEARKRIRLATRDRVGFDPYDESPIKRRGEDYQRHNQDQEHYEDEWAEEGNYEQSPEMQDMPSSPLLLRSREHSSRSRTGTPQKGVSRTSRQSTPNRDTPPFPGKRTHGLGLSTPPNTTKSRQAFLRDEAGKSTSGRGSPLARSDVHSSSPAE